jgi:hypothetical protein
MPDNSTVARDLKERFPRLLSHLRPDIVCDECKSIIATLHAPSVRRPGGRAKKSAKASEMAAQEIDRLIDPSAPDEERQRRKRRLLKGPKEFRDIRGKR